MELILWRHAEAEPGFPDSGRALTEKGRKQAKRVAKWLRRRLPDDWRMLVSPAVRAQQTAAALSETFETVADVDTDAAPQAVLSAAGWPAGDGCVIVCGHQPTLGQAAALALTGSASHWDMRKGAVWWLTHEHGVTTLRAVIGPDLVRG